MMMYLNLVLVWCFSARAEMIADPQALIQSRFQDATVANQNILLSPEETKRVQDLVGHPVEDKIFSFFVAKRKNHVVGYAGLATRKVRSKDQTALYFISKSGELESIELVAFYEPPEYTPKREWLKGFSGQKDPKAMKLGGQVRVVSGATLTAQSFMESARIILAVWRERFASPSAGK